MHSSLQKAVLVIAILMLTACGASAENSALRTLATSGKGIATAKADIAVIQMQTTAISKSASAAKQTVDQGINNALDALKVLAINSEDTVASTLRINPEYQYDNRERLFSGYRATRDLTVTLRELDKLDRLLETLTAAGINNILSITMESSMKDELRANALTSAIEDSKVKARQLAQAYGAELGNIHTITYASNSPIFQGAPVAMEMKAASGSGGQYIHDTIKIEDNIEVVFELIINQ